MQHEYAYDHAHMQPGALKRKSWRLVLLNVTCATVLTVEDRRPYHIQRYVDMRVCTEKHLSNHQGMNLREIMDNDFHDKPRISRLSVFGWLTVYVTAINFTYDNRGNGSDVDIHSSDSESGMLYTHVKEYMQIRG